MIRFFDLTFVWFFVITGIGTAAAGLYAFWPRWTVKTIGKIPFVREYTIITQHWGIMVGLMGVFMIAAALLLQEQQECNAHPPDGPGCLCGST